MRCQLRYFMQTTSNFVKSIRLKRWQSSKDFLWKIKLVHMSHILLLIFEVHIERECALSRFTVEAELVVNKKWKKNFVDSSIYFNLSLFGWLGFWGSIVTWVRCDSTVTLRPPWHPIALTQRFLARRASCLIPVNIFVMITTPFSLSVWSRPMCGDEWASWNVRCATNFKETLCLTKKEQHFKSTSHQGVRCRRVWLDRSALKFVEWAHTNNAIQ